MLLGLVLVSLLVLLFPPHESETISIFSARNSLAAFLSDFDFPLVLLGDAPGWSDCGMLLAIVELPEEELALACSHSPWTFTLCPTWLAISLLTALDGTTVTSLFLCLITY